MVTSSLRGSYVPAGEEHREATAGDAADLRALSATLEGAGDQPAESEAARLSRFPIVTILLVAFLAFIVISTGYNFLRARRERGLADVEYTADGQRIIYLNMWDIPRPGEQSPTGRAERAVIERFKEKHPHVRIRRTRGIQVEGEAQESSFLMAMAGGTAPDIFYHNFRSVRSYMKQGFCLDLTDFIMNDWSAEKRTELLWRRIQPILGDEVRQPDGSVKYHYYAVPMSFDDLHGIYFRKDLFLKAGFSTEGPETVCRDWGAPWNWDALYRMSQKLTIPEEGQYGYNIQAAFFAGWMWPNFVWQAGGEIVREWVRCPKCRNITPVPKDADGIPVAAVAAWRCGWRKCTQCNHWNPPPEWADKAWWRLPEVAGDKPPEDAWKCGKCGADLHTSQAHGVDLAACPRFWRTAYDEPPGVEALGFYRRLRWTYWTRCRSAQCQGRNVTYDITYGMLGVNDPLLRDRGVLGSLYDKKMTYGKAGVIAPAYRDSPVAGMPASEAEALEKFAVCPECGNSMKLADLKQHKQLYQGVAFASQNWDDAARMFREDRTLAMTIRWTSTNFVGSPSFTPDEFGVVGLPEGPGGIRANFLNSRLVSINSAVTDAAKQQACWEFIKFLTSDEADELRVRVCVENGLARFIHPGKLARFGYDEYLQFVPESWKQVFNELLENGQPEPYCPDYKSVATQELAKPIDEVLFQPDVLPQDVLAASGGQVNRNTFGVVPPRVMRNRRVVAYLLAALMVAFLGVMFALFIRSLRLLIKAQGAAGGASFLRTSIVTAWLFMVPGIATILLWQYVPLVRGSVMAFMDYYILKPSSVLYLDNFITVMTDEVFWVSVLNTFLYTAFIILIGFGAPILLALLLSEVPRWKILFRVIFYLPAVTSGLVIMFLWKQFYNPSPAGTFNTILGWFGVSPQAWLQDPTPGVALLCIVLPGVWAGAGPGSIVYLAALKAVPEEMYEAADIDGAGTFQKIWRITFPFLKPLILINFVGAFIGAFQATENIFVMTGGGPGHKTLTLSLNIYLRGFLFLKFGQATAIAWLMGSLLIGFTIYQLRILRDVRFTAAANQ